MTDLFHKEINPEIIKHRYQQALDIQAGAVNPSAIAHSIKEACQEIRAEGGDTKAICDDPAVRLMVHQLDFLVKASSLEGNGCSDDYLSCMTRCEEMAKKQ